MYNGGFREKVSRGCKMNKLYFINSHSESQDSEFLDAEEFAQLSFIVFEIRRNEACRKLAYFYGKKRSNSLML